MKIIISKDVLNEIKTYKNDVITHGAYSKVFLGKNIVKKTPNNGYSDFYSEEEMEKFEFMTQYPNIFPHTVIQSNKLVIQTKVDTEPIMKFFTELKERPSYYTTLFNNIAINGIEKCKEAYELRYYTINEKLRPMLKNFCNLANKLHKIGSNNFYDIDLNYKNWGIEYGKLKIIDF